MTKSAECAGCPLIECPGPIPSELNDQVGWDLVGDTDVMFASEAPGRNEIIQGRPFSGQAGKVLRSSLKQAGISKFGIVNVWRCRPPENKLPGGEPGAFCKKLFVSDLLAHNQKVTVALGATGLDALTESKLSIMKVQGRMFEVSLNGSKLLVLPMLHPAFLLRQRAWWRDWELSFTKLANYLNGTGLNYIPLSERHVHMARSTVDVLAFIEELKKHSTIACDIETTSFNMPWESGEIICASFAVSSTETYAIPWRFITQALHDKIKYLMEEPGRKWVWYNGPYDVQFFWAEGIQARIDGDAMVEMHLLDERLNVHSLKKDAAVWLNALDWEEGIKKYKIPNDTSEEAKQAWRDIPEDELLEYNGQDTTHTFHLSQVARTELGEKLCAYADTLVVPGYAMLARARMVGIRVDLYKVKELRETFAPTLSELEHKLVVLSGDAFFNPRSPLQVLPVLKKRGLDVRNTCAETLDEFEGDEFVDALTEYRQADKMNSTYVEGIVDDISDDLRVHPDWRMPTETGRDRTSDPNILGMPRKAEESEHRWKRRIKEMFIADPNTLLMHVDRKQSEVRCACFLSGDEILARVIKSGRDLHGEMARLMYGDNFTHEERVWAKMVTFGLIYNREAPSLSRQLTAVNRKMARGRGEAAWHVCSVREAQRIIDDFFTKMPRLLEWKKELEAEAVREQELTSWFGRKRRFGMVTWENVKDVKNEAVNFPPSSLSTDLNKLSCIETMRQFGKYGVEVLAPVHDSGLLRIPKSGSESLVQEIKGMWEALIPKVLSTDLPFSVDVGVGERWSDL
jgi:uracil-DNA glycosylase family 4